MRHQVRLVIQPGGQFLDIKRPVQPCVQRLDVDKQADLRGLPGEQPAEAALREFEEETGVAITAVPFKLTTVRQAGGKIVEVYAVEGDFDPAALNSNSFSMEWPPRSGKQQEYPELDRAEWMTLAEARRRMLPSQQPILDALEARLG